MDPQALVEEAASFYPLPGLSIAIGSERDGIRLGDLSPEAPSALYPIASITKTFTAFRVLELARQAELSLDRPLDRQLPGFALQDEIASATMTPRDSLCHFSGLPPHTWSWVYGDLDRTSWIHERLPYLEAVGPHRVGHRYSNILYAVLGALIEEVTEMSWEEDLEESFAPSPVVMNPATVVEAPPAFQLYEGQLESLSKPIVLDHHVIAPASELMMRVPDLADWGLDVLASPEFDSLKKPHVSVSRERPHPAMGPLWYGLGWRIDSVQGRTRLWHSGQCSGYTSLVSLDPEQGTVFAAACPLHGSVEVLHALDLQWRAGVDMNWAEISPRGASSRNDTRVVEASDLSEGTYWNDGYGCLDLIQGPAGLETLFQEQALAPLVQTDQGYALCLPEYDAYFPFTALPSGDVAVAFEPAVAPIRFSPAGRS